MKAQEDDSHIHTRCKIVYNPFQSIISDKFLFLYYLPKMKSTKERECDYNFYIAFTVSGISRHLTHRFNSVIYCWLHSKALKS